MKESEKRYLQKRQNLRAARGEDASYLKEKNSVKTVNYLIFLAILYLVAYIYFSYFHFA